MNTVKVHKTVIKFEILCSCKQWISIEPIDNYARFLYSYYKHKV
jgi:hypothetical protein